MKSFQIQTVLSFSLKIVRFIEITFYLFQITNEGFNYSTAANTCTNTEGKHYTFVSTKTKFEFTAPDGILKFLNQNIVCPKQCHKKFDIS